MKVLIIIFAGCFFFLSHGIAAGQPASTATDTLLIHISGQHYPKLNLVFILEDNRNYVSEGIMIDDSTWRFVYPQNTYDEHLRVKLSVKEAIPDRTIYLEADRDSRTPISESFGIPLKGGKIALLFYKNIEDNFYKGCTSDIFDVIDPDSEIFINIQCAYLFRNFSYDRYLSEIRKLIKQHPDSHYMMVRLWEFDYFFKTKQDMLLLYNTFSEDARNSYFGKKVKKIIDIKNTIIIN